MEKAGMLPRPLRDVISTAGHLTLQLRCFLGVTGLQGLRQLGVEAAGRRPPPGLPVLVLQPHMQQRYFRKYYRTYVEKYCTWSTSLCCSDMVLANWMSLVSGSCE